MPETLSLPERRWLAMADAATLCLPPGAGTVIDRCLDLGLIEASHRGQWRLSARGARFRFDVLQNGNGLQPAGS